MASYVIEIRKQNGAYYFRPCTLQVSTGDVIMFHSVNIPVLGNFHSGQNGAQCFLTRLHPPLVFFNLSQPDFSEQFLVGHGNPCKFKCTLTAEGNNTVCNDGSPVEGSSVIPDVEIDINP